MANMSYCRFRNTRIDLEDCVCALEDLTNGEGDLSLEEKQSALAMYDLCKEFMVYYEELVEDDIL